jgi:hypothetical protein
LESANPKWELFDDQASVFEERAGLPAEYCAAIARAVTEIANLGPGDLILEIGPGTGQLGLEFRSPLRYMGLDLSGAMLKEFQRRLGGDDGNRLLVRADAAAAWPLISGEASAFFSSRALHLLPVEHVASEVFRLARPAGATLIIGRVARDPASVRSRMAREMNERLRGRGYQAHRGERQSRKLIELCRDRGAAILEPVHVARWKVSTMPRQSIDSWRALKGLGGVPLPGKTRDEILTELESWARETFGEMDLPVESEETYVLTAVRVHAADW